MTVVICVGCKTHMELSKHCRLLVLAREPKRIQAVHGNEWRCPECGALTIVIPPSVVPFWSYDLPRYEGVLEIGKHTD